MIDRTARDTLAENIRHLVAGLISNDEFESRIPWNSSDSAIREITLGGPWHLYSDMREHRLSGKFSVPKQQREESARWILFLKSDLPYEWPQTSELASLIWLPLHLLTLGYTAKSQQRSFSQQGDMSVWPFLRASDFEIHNKGILHDKQHP